MEYITYFARFLNCECGKNTYSVYLFSQTQYGYVRSPLSVLARVLAVRGNILRFTDLRIGNCQFSFWPPLPPTVEFWRKRCAGREILDLASFLSLFTRNHFSRGGWNPTLEPRDARLLLRGAVQPALQPAALGCRVSNTAGSLK